MSLGIAFVLLLGLADETKKTDAERLQGNWTVSEFLDEGAKMPSEKMSVTFKDDKMHLLVDGKEEETYTFKLDSSKKPARIDIIEKEGKIPGIYEIDSDTVKLCWNKTGKDERPTDFKATEKNRWSLMVLKRKK